MIAKSIVLIMATFLIASQALGQHGHFSRQCFLKADSIASLYPKYSLRDLRGLALKLTTPLQSDTEKFRAIYRWVCNNIESDHVFFETHKRKFERLKRHGIPEGWNKEFSSRLFSKLINEHKTICVGYAYLLKELSFHAGIPCVLIHGYGRNSHTNVGGKGTMNHSWNAVKLNNQWYLCDGSRSAGSYDATNRRHIKKFDDAYFLSDPSIFIRNHYPVDTSWALISNKPSLEQFLNAPITYSYAYNFPGIDVLPEAFNIMAKKGEPVLFELKHSSNIEVSTVYLQANRKGTTETVTPSFYKDNDNSYHIQQTFFSKGDHIVHILLNGHYVLSYKVRVM